MVDSIRGGVAELTGESARHLTRVLRVEAGQRFEISDGREAWLAEISEAHGPRVVFRVVEPLKMQQLPARVGLCAALIKFDRFEWMIQKATELGVDHVLPVETARTEKGLFHASAKRRERWTRIAIEATAQSRRLSAPPILPAVRLPECLTAGEGVRYRMEENTAPPLAHLLAQSVPLEGAVRLLVGPEGGWTDEERRATAQAGWQPASLGPCILRAETAAIAAIAVVSAWAASSQYNRAGAGDTSEEPRAD